MQWTKLWRGKIFSPGVALDMLLQRLLHCETFLLREDNFNNDRTSLLNIHYFLFGKAGEVLELDLRDKLPINQH